MVPTHGVCGICRTVVVINNLIEVLTYVEPTVSVNSIGKGFPHVERHRWSLLFGYFALLSYA